MTDLATLGKAMRDAQQAYRSKLRDDIVYVEIVQPTEAAFDAALAAPPVAQGEYDGLIVLLRELAATKHDDLGIAADAADAIAALQAERDRAVERAAERASDEYFRLQSIAEAAQARIAALEEALETYVCTCPDGYCEVGTFDDTICGHRARAALASQ